jgi:predicted  nucleic acid-binding Zn-ribbon protein
MIDFLDRIEAAEKEIETQKADFDRVTADVGEERAALVQEMDEARKCLAALDEKRAEVEARVAPVLLDKYRRIRSRGLSIAITPVIQAICQGCHMNIPPQMFNELQRFDSLKLCPFCERIIYWKQAESGEAATDSQ